MNIFSFKVEKIPFIEDKQYGEVEKKVILYISLSMNLIFYALYF